MNCSEFQKLLDAYIDGELDGVQRAEFEAYAAKCDSCAQALRAAEQLRDFLVHMNDELAVPLPAQAAWRKAVRAEARKRRMKRVYAACGAVAAVCAVTIGTVAMLGSNPVAPNAEPRSVAYVEADGISDEAVLEDPVAMLGASDESAAIAYVDRHGGLRGGDRRGRARLRSDSRGKCRGFLERGGSPRRRTGRRCAGRGCGGADGGNLRDSCRDLMCKRGEPR